MEYNEEYNELTEATEPVEEVEAIEETEEVAEYEPQFADAMPETEEAVAPVTKKKFPIQSSIIIAACILFVAVIGFFAVSIFTPTVEGTWLYSSEEGYDFYYNLDETSDGNKCVMSIGTVYFPGIYESNVAEDGTKSVAVSVYAGYINGNYTYSIEGVRLFGNRVMTLTGEDGTTFTLTQAKQPKDSDYVKPDENFEPVEELVGEWEFLYEEFGESYKLTINDDGTMIFDQFGLQEIHFAYTADDKKVNLSFFETEVIAQEEEYYFKDDQLIFLGLNWTKVTDSTADQK